MTKSGRTRRPGRKVILVKFGSAHVPIYQGSVRGDTRFTVSFYQNGRRIRRTFDSLAKATEEARTAAMKIQQGLAEVADMRVADRQNYHAATSLLGSLSVPLVAAVEEYVRCRELLGNSPLLSAIEEHVRRINGLRMGASVADVVKEFMAAKEEDGVSKRYLAQLRSDLNRFAEFFHCPILHVKSERIDEWLRSLKVALRTRNGTLTSVRTLFSFAKSRSYLPKNEITEADALNKSKVGDTDTVIFEPPVMRKLLDAAPPQLIPFLAIGAFAGLRSAEIARLEWTAINFERGIIEIRAGQAKTASRRILPVSDNLRAWLAPLARTGPVIRDGWLVDYEPVVISSQVKMNGVFLKEGEQIGKVDTQTGTEALDQMEDERAFDATAVEHDITAPDCNRKIIQEIAKHAFKHEQETGRLVSGPRSLNRGAQNKPCFNYRDRFKQSGATSGQRFSAA